MKEIYIILYSDNYVDGFYFDESVRGYADDNFFDDKNKAIKYIESKEYKHLCDDEYKDVYEKRAEIIKIIKWEDE